MKWLIVCGVDELVCAVLYPLEFSLLREKKTAQIECYEMGMVVSLCVRVRLIALSHITNERSISNPAQQSTCDRTFSIDEYSHEIAVDTHTNYHFQ